MTFWIILALAGWVSFLSLRHHNMLLSLGASIMWLALMAYNLNYPPTNIVQGDTIHEWMTMGFVIIAMAMMFMWFRERGRSVSQTRVTANEDGINISSEKQEGLPRTSLMDAGNEEYRARVRRAVRSKRR